MQGSKGILKFQAFYTSQLLHTLKNQKGLVVNHNEIDRDF